MLVCTICRGYSDLQCQCGTAYCSKQCQLIDWKGHADGCTPLMKRTLALELVPDAIGLSSAGWRTPLSIQRANEFFMLYGMPKVVNEGQAIWKGSLLTPFIRVEVHDRSDLRSNQPYPHLHVVFMTLLLQVDANRSCGLLTVSPGITYDAMAMECTAGGESREDCVAALTAVQEYATGQESAESVRKRLLQSLLVASKESKEGDQLVRLNKAYSFRATPRTDKMIDKL